MFRNLWNNFEDCHYVPGPFQFSNLLQLLSKPLYQDSSSSFFYKVDKRQLKIQGFIQAVLLMSVF